MTRQHRERPDEDDEDDQVVVVNKSSGISPFLIGLAVGAGLALLFAPASGAETRRRLAGGARRLRSAATDAVSEKVEETFQSVRDQAAEHIDAVRDTIATKRGQVTRAVSEGRTAAKQARQDIEKRLAETKAAYHAGARVARESKPRDD